MKRLLSFVSCAALLTAPLATGAQPAQGVIAGPHGYDWLVGAWTCVNKNPSVFSGPATAKLTVSHTAGTALFARTTGSNFDVVGYVAYDTKTHTWWAPSAFADGGHESESSTSTGKTATFSGTYYPAGAPAQKVRDLYTLVGTGKYTDVGQTQSAGAWKTLYTITCTKT